MKHEVVHGPSFALLKVRLEAGESITAEAGAMVTRQGRVAMKTRLNAGTRAGIFGRLIAFFIALFRKVIGGETMFINEFTAEAQGEVSFAPPLAGQIAHRRLDNERIMLTTGSFLACGPGIDMRMRWGGLRGILSKEGLVFLELSGTGDLFMTAYGGIQAVPVDGRFVVDNGHMVAFDAGLDFRITSAGGGVMGLVASGEGLVCELTGRGTVYIQSRNVGALVGWLARLLP
ncbi:MAG: TIGR00266 family protein [Myxococcales bacterium]